VYKVKWLVIIAIIVLIGLLLPIFSLIAGITSFPQIGEPAFSFLSFIMTSYAQRLVVASLEFSIAHAVLAVGIAILYAWLVGRTDIPWKKFFEALPVLGLTMPMEVKAFAWIFLLDPHVGMLNLLLTSIFGPVTINIYGMGGMIWVAMLGGIPLAYLVIMPAMKSIDSSLEEASRTSGWGTLATFYSVTLRLLFPAIISAFLLSTINGLSNFDYPFLIGQPANVHTLSTEVYFWTFERSPPSYGSAGIISIIYVIVTAISVSMYVWATRRTYKYVVVTGRTGRRVDYKLRRWKPLAVLGCFLVIFFEFILPFVTLLLESSSNIYLNHSFENIHFDFPKAYIMATSLPYFYSSLTVTFEFGLVAAALVTLVSALLSYAALKNKARGARLTEYVTSIPLAFPGVVYGIALTWMFLIVPGLARFYGTLVPLVFSLVVIGLPSTTRIISANLVQISSELEEASQVSGSTFRRTFASITLPLIKDGIINSFVYALVNSLRELGGVIILTSPAALAFTALLLNYYDSHSPVENVIAAGSVILTGLIVILLVMLKIAERVTGKAISKSQFDL